MSTETKQTKWRCYPEFGPRHSAACYSVWDGEDNFLTHDHDERFRIARLISKAPTMAELLRLMAWKNENGYTVTDVQHWLDTATRLVADLEAK